MSLVVFALIMLYVISWWKVFEKAGQKGWLTLIPGVNFIYFLKISELKSVDLPSIIICS